MVEVSDQIVQSALAAAGVPLTYSGGTFGYQWPEALSEAEQLRVLAQATGFHAQHPAPVFYTKNDSLFAHWYFPDAGEMTAGQARAAVDTLTRGIAEFSRAMGVDTDGAGVDWEADADPVTYDRIKRWFAGKGQPELPEDEETGALCLAMDGTPVDIEVGEMFSVQVSARVPDADPASLLHYCNQLNRVGFPAVCVVMLEEQWWAVSKYSVEARAGLSDAQLDEAIRKGVTGAGAQVRDLLRLHRG